MSDELSTPTSMEGQAESTAPDTSTEGQGQAQEYSQDAGQAPQAPAPTGEPSFDPNAIPAELLPAYKQMQADYTRKTQALAQHRQKIDAYDQFMRDPVGSLQQLASQYGLQITRAQAAQMVAAGEHESQQWEPQTWDEVISRAEERAEQRVLQRLSPYIGQMQSVAAKTVEQQLNGLDPQWRTYEAEMSRLLQNHPSLAQDVGALYRLAVPSEVIEAKAMQTVLKKYEEKAKHAQVTQQGTAPRSSPASPKIKSFEEAYADAKRKILSGEA